MCPLSRELGLLELVGPLFVVILEANLGVKTASMRCLENALFALFLESRETTALCASKALCLRNVAWLPSILLEIDKSAAENWFGTKSAWSYQFSVYCWLEALSNLLDGVLHLRLLDPIVLIDLFSWVQVWVVSVTLSNIYKFVRHAWAEYLLELSECQVSLVCSINQLHHRCYFLSVCGHLDRLEALMEVIIRNITVFILIKLSEHLEKLYFSVEDLVLHLV